MTARVLSTSEGLFGVSKTGIVVHLQERCACLNGMPAILNLVQDLDASNVSMRITHGIKQKRRRVVPFITHLLARVDVKACKTDFVCLVKESCN